jgi:RNA polymerase sigma-70 factor (ECF subfamily)
MTALLVGDGERSAKLASYRGAGRLLHWIRVATARMRTDAGRAAARQPKNPRAELDVEHLLGPVELEREAFKHEYAPQIRSAFQRGLQQLDPKARTVLRQHLLDGLSQRQIAKLYGVDHKTVGRRLERARDEVWTAVREELERTLALDSAQLRSVIELVRSQLDLSLSRML